MRVHVISDMEGVAGIVKWEQTTGGESLYEEGRKLYTEEINAAHALRFRVGVELVDARTIVSRADTWWEAWKQFYF